jgi:hypothetical protein
MRPPPALRESVGAAAMALFALAYARYRRDLGNGYDRLAARILRVAAACGPLARRAG